MQLTQLLQESLLESVCIVLSNRGIGPEIYSVIAKEVCEEFFVGIDKKQAQISKLEEVAILEEALKKSGA